MKGNISSVVTGIILIVLAFLLFGIVLDSVVTILDWAGTGGTTLADFTGLEQLVTISPLLVFIGLLVAGGWLTFRGFAGEGGRSRGRGLH